jgi:hypothetical protein
MAALVLVFCLATAPGHCQEERPLLADLSLMSCPTQGQQYASDWLVNHPKWTLSGWRCEQNVPRQRQSRSLRQGAGESCRPALRSGYGG